MPVRVAISAALVGGLLLHAGPATILEQIARADLSLLAAAFVALVAYSTVKAWIWHRLLIGLGINRPKQFLGVVVCYLSAGLFGTLLPSTAGTDAVRAVLAHRRFGGKLSPYAASVVVLNGVNWLAACTMGLIAIGVSSFNGVPALAFIAAPLLAAVIGGIVTLHLLLKYRRDWWLALLRRAPASWRRARGLVRRFASQLLVFERAHVRFGPVFIAALMAQVGVATTLWLTGLAVGIDLDVHLWLVYGPLISTAALIPFSVAGFGADQGVYVYFMSFAAVAEAQALVASALGSTLSLVFNVGLGGLVFALGPRAPDQPVRATDKSLT
jgi:hypothetical protein